MPVVGYDDVIPTEGTKIMKRIAIETVTPGTKLDQGIFASLQEVNGNPNVWEVKFTDGLAYVETRGAKVRTYGRIDAGDLADRIGYLIEEADKTDRQLNDDVRIASVDEATKVTETETGPVAEFIVSTSDNRSFIISVTEFLG